MAVHMHMALTAGLSHTAAALSRQSQPLLIHGRIRRTRLTQAVIHRIARHRCVHRRRVRARGHCTGITRLRLARRAIFLLVASGALARSPLVINPLLTRLRVLESALGLQARLEVLLVHLFRDLRSPCCNGVRRVDVGVRSSHRPGQARRADGCPPRWWPPAERPASAPAP